MNRLITILALICVVAFQVNAQPCDWSELIGKKLVLSRWGQMMDGFFLDYNFSNTFGKKPTNLSKLSLSIRTPSAFLSAKRFSWLSM